MLELSEDTDDDEWIVPITVNDTIIAFKLDTGAQANLMSEADYRKLTAKRSCQDQSARLQW